MNFNLIYKERIMKKYFMKGTEDEVQFGDMIQLDFTKHTENGKVKHQHLECEFVPGIVDYLLEEEIIEEKEFKEEPVRQGILNFDFEDEGNECPEEDFDPITEAFDDVLGYLDNMVRNLDELNVKAAKILTILQVNGETKKVKK